ncbi:MAG: cobalamin-dependent protein, partial [Gemmatimonadota bacterium]
SAWETGRVGPAHEHLATVVIRRFLEWMLGSATGEEGAPVLVAATPAGERHELGALLSAVSAAAEGWEGIFLGPDLPSEEIVSAAVRLKADVVTLSCVDPGTAEFLPEEVRKIRDRLPPAVHLVLGGPLAVSKGLELRTEGVEVLPTFEELRAKLREIGSKARASSQQQTSGYIRDSVDLHE